MTMKASSFVRSICAAVVVGALAVFFSGCSSCKPGKPGKPKAYHVTVNLGESLQQASVVVDLVVVNSASLPRWESYSLNEYWKDKNPMRLEADKVTMSFVSGK